MPRQAFLSEGELGTSRGSIFSGCEVQVEKAGFTAEAQNTVGARHAVPLHLFPSASSAPPR